MNHIDYSMYQDPILIINEPLSEPLFDTPMKKFRFKNRHYISYIAISASDLDQAIGFLDYLIKHTSQWKYVEDDVNLF